MDCDIVNNKIDKPTCFICANVSDDRGKHTALVVCFYMTSEVLMIPLKITEAHSIKY